MALVTKNDVTQIFAIQAPSIDLPPTFANYPRGWDMALTTKTNFDIHYFETSAAAQTNQFITWCALGN